MSETLGMSEGNLRVSIFRALRRLRALVDGVEERESEELAA